MNPPNILPTPDPTQNAGGAVFDTTETSGTPAAPAVVAPPETPAVPTTPTPTAQLSKEELSQILQTAVKAGQPAPVQPAYTQDDFDKTFNVFKPTPDLISAIRTGDENGALAAIASMVQGVVKQAVTMSAYQMQELRDELSRSMQPALTFAQQQGERQLKEEFFEAHKDLKQYEPLVLKVTADLKQQGAVFKDKPDAFKRVSDETRNLLKTILPNGTLPAAPIGPAPHTSQMSTLSSGGQGGAGGGGQPAKSKSPGLAVFD